MSPGNVKAPVTFPSLRVGGEDRDRPLHFKTFIPPSCLLDSQLLGKVGALWDRLQECCPGAQKRAGRWGWGREKPRACVGQRGAGPAADHPQAFPVCLTCNDTVGLWSRCFDKG